MVTGPDVKLPIEPKLAKAADFAISNASFDELEVRAEGGDAKAEEVKQLLDRLVEEGVLAKAA